MTGARLYRDLRKSPGCTYTYETLFEGMDVDVAWESDTQIQLQYAGSRERVEDLPATFLDGSRCEKAVCAVFGRGGPDVHGVRVRGPSIGLDVRSSYVHVKGLWFMNYSSAVMVRPDRSRFGDHVTIEDLRILRNGHGGPAHSEHATVSYKNNYGVKNGERGEHLHAGERTSQGRARGQSDRWQSSVQLGADAPHAEHPSPLRAAPLGWQRAGART